MSLGRSIWLVTILSAAALAACTADFDSAPTTTPALNAGAGPATDADAGIADGINTTGVGAGTGANTGLPCDVQQVIENRCVGCHLGPSPVKLLTYEDLLKPSATDPKKSLAEVSLDRMKDGANPMPPKPAALATADEVGALDAWIKGGSAKAAEACTTAPPANAPSLDGGASPFNTPVVCTSKRTWKDGDDGSSSMRPGGACITCHSQKGGPNYSVAGTVYATAHEPNDCNGVSGQASVVVTDLQGKVLTTMQVNRAGNFYSRNKITAPYKVKVVRNGVERAMAGTVTAGDCNTCHTEKGVNGAPGRVMAP